jgi:hypothetical protein
MGVDGKRDRMETLVAMDTKSIATQLYAAEKFGADSEAAKIKFENGDTSIAMVRTTQGKLIEVRYDTASPRPAGMGQYSLQGTKGAYDSAFGIRKCETAEEVWGVLNDLDNRNNWRDHPSQFLIERFIEGRVFHVDSVVNKGKVVAAGVSQYGTTPF